MKRSISWDMTPRSLLKVNQRCPACCLRHADFLLGLCFDPEDEGDIFFRNFG
jgi:hypothetical protein